MNEQDMKLYAGGTLSPREHYYVERKEDRLLYKLSKEGEYCYILAARQLGKSSLAANAITKLEKDNITCLYVDLQGISKQIPELNKALEKMLNDPLQGVGDPIGELSTRRSDRTNPLLSDYQNKWYLSLLHAVLKECKEVRDEVDLENWWINRQSLDNIQKVTSFFSEIILSRIPDHVVVFFDEIDRFPEPILSDDFFSALRKMHNDRFNSPEFKRLSFVIIGHRLPRTLVQNKSISPFNIGTRLDLEDLQFENAMILANKIKSGSGITQRQIMEIVFSFTGGHPYMTHEACKYITDITNDDEEDRVYLNSEEQIVQIMEDLIRKTFAEKHLNKIRDWLNALPNQSDVLRLYGYILDGNNVVFDETILALDDLRYSGLIKITTGIAKIRNRIYAQVFNRGWVVYQLRQSAAVAPADFSIGLEKMGIQVSNPEVGAFEDQPNLNRKPINIEALPANHASAFVNTLNSDAQLSPDNVTVPTESFAELTDNVLHERLTGIGENATTKENLVQDSERQDIGRSPENKLHNNVIEKDDLREAQELELDNANASTGITSKLKKLLSIIEDKRTLLTIAGAVIAVSVIFWGLYVHSTFSLIVSGTFLVVVLVVVSVLIGVTSERSLVEERLGRYLEEDERDVSKEPVRSAATEWLNRRVESSSLSDRVARELARANVSLKVAEYFALLIISTIAFALIFYLIQPLITSALIGVVIGFLLPRLYIKRRQRIRLKKLDEQLSDTLSLMVNGLRAGYSTMQTLEAISRELPVPISDEFRRVVQEMQVGIPMETALDNMLRRVPSNKWDFVFTAINVQRETGGNLSEILDYVRSKLWDQTRVITEGQRLAILSFDFFYAASVLIVMFQSLFFPNVFDSILKNEFLFNVLFLLMIIWSLVLIVGSAIRIRKDQLMSQFEEQNGNVFFLHILLLVLAYLLGVSQFLCVWLAIMLFSRTKMGLVVSSLIWLLVAGSYIASVNFLFFTFKPDRMQMVILTFERVENFLSKSLPNTLPLDIQLRSFSPLSCLVLAVVVTFVFAIVIVFFGLRRNAQGEEDDPLQARLAEFIQRGDVKSLEEIELSQPFAERFIIPIIHYIGEFFGRFSPQWATQNTFRRLELAGNPWSINAPTFLAIRFISAFLFGGFLLTIILISPVMNPTADFIYVLGTIFVGYYLPSWMLTSRIVRRQSEIRKALPDSIDLLTICIEAGLGFDAAMSKVSEKSESELSLAFARTIREVQLGKVRREALRDMADRIGVPELTLFVAGFIQSEQLGVSLARWLRNQSYEFFVNLRDRTIRELDKLDLISKTLFFILFGPIFVFWFLLPVLMKLPVFP
jgi:Flp pilus assembly protein TadB